MQKMILVGDIGGTKTHLALVGEKGRQIIHEKIYHSAEHKKFSEIVKSFLADHPTSVEKACFGMAGPIQQGVAHTTNLPWTIDAAALSSECHIPHVWLINDLEAHAHGIQELSAKELFTLNAGKEKEGNRALIAAGTGLGEAGFFWDGNIHRPFATEGGHCSFAPETLEEVELYRYLASKFSHVSYERILSGPGLENIYRFLVDCLREPAEPLIESCRVSGEIPRLITSLALEKKSKACEKALELFVSIYGSEAGNLALKMLSFAGVFIAGGIAPKILPALQTGLFMKRFSTKGRFQKLLQEMPVHVILNEGTALLGAARYARERG